MARQRKNNNSAPIKEPAQSKLQFQPRGRFIVIEGTDGSGKGTQIELLKQKLENDGVPVKIIDFPRYTENIYGRLVGRYLKGEFGGLADVSPYLASLAYAGDRMLAKKDLDKWLNEGYFVIANRYVISNKIYMSARLAEEDRPEFLRWLEDLEYGANGIPREDLVIFLYVPPQISQQNVDKKAARSWLEGAGKRDIMERDLEYQIEVGKTYMKFAQTDPNWAFIECTEDGEMLGRDEVNHEIIDILISRGILKRQN